MGRIARFPVARARDPEHSAAESELRRQAAEIDRVAFGRPDSAGRLRLAALGVIRGRFIVTPDPGQRSVNLDPSSGLVTRTLDRNGRIRLSMEERRLLGSEVLFGLILVREPLGRIIVVSAVTMAERWLEGVEDGQ